jgi:thiol-disulfide isomerase/thioredoxin
MNRTQWLRRTFAVLLATAALGALVASPAHAQGLDDEERSPRVRISGSLPQSDEIGTAGDPAIGKTAPTLKGLSLTGKKITVGNGETPRIVLFLSHSCPHCQVEVPAIVKLAKQGKLDGVEIDTVTTNTTTDLPNWPPSKWLRREHWPFRPVLADDAKLSAFSAYGGTAFPYFVFVGTDGKVVARATGELPPATVAEGVSRLLSGKSFFAN